MNIPELNDHLRWLGVADLYRAHPAHLAHLIGVYWVLWQCRAAEDVCRAGLFHSIYGTEVFHKVVLPLEKRAALRDLIGPRAEWLAYLNCVMDRQSFDRAVQQGAGPWQVTNRLTGGSLELSADDFTDLCQVHLCDWAERVPNGKWWNYRRAAYRRLAERLGGPALETYWQVIAQEAPPASPDTQPR